jgi:hypothetical protein
LNADVKAFDRLQIVRDWNSSYFGSKYKIVHGPRELFWSFQFAFNKRLVDHNLGCYIRQFTSLPGFHLPSHRLEIALHPVNHD